MLTMRRRWSEERRESRQEAEWIVAWLRDNGPASIRDIVNALNSAGRGVKAHVIRRALLKSQFVIKSGEVMLQGEKHSLYSFDSGLEG